MTPAPPPETPEDPSDSSADPSPSSKTAACEKSANPTGFAAPVDHDPANLKAHFELRSSRPASVKADVLAGLTVAFAMVPEVVAFAFVLGVNPLIGLYSAFVVGFIAAVFGGRPGMVSGAAGAMAVVTVGLVAIHGITYLFPAVILCGLIQITIGVLRLGKLIRMVPHSVMLGFVNGLAIVIGAAQIGSFKEIGTDGFMHYLETPRLLTMLGLVALTMAIIHYLPKLTKAIPSSLAAIVVVTLLTAGINATWTPTDGGPSAVPTVRDMLASGQKAAAVGAAAKDEVKGRAAAAAALIDQAGLVGPGVEGDAKVVLGRHGISEAIHALPAETITAAIASVKPENVTIKGDLPIPFFFDDRYTSGGPDGASLIPPMNLATLWIILPFALVLAGVGLIESLMTMTLIDELTETRGQGNRECVGQGVGNVLCGVFGGMGGCAMIGQSLINVKSGGKGRLSGITVAVCLLLFVLLFASWIEMVPMAALVGVMFMVVIGTFEWTTLNTWHKIPLSDVLVMIFVAAYTVVMHDLASAVILGVVISALVFAWKKSTHLFADVKVDEKGGRIYQLHGPLFFASVDAFKELFQYDTDPDDVVIDFYFTRVYDQSGLEAINAVTEKYGQRGKRVHLKHLSEECQALLGKAGDLVEPNISEDPHYHVATDRLG
ncbi:MAG: SulP family inorganic anion transporter [Algisphaera sp.]